MPPTTIDQPSSERSRRIKLGVTIGAFGIAVIVFALGARSPRPTEAADVRPVDFLCVKCHKNFTIGFEEFARVTNQGTIANEGPSAGTGRGRSILERSVELTCPGCGQRSGRPASYCSKHDVYFLKHTPKGANARCPQCVPPKKEAS